VSYSIEVGAFADGTVIEASGDIDAAAADDLIAALSNATADERAHELVIVDLSGANFLDSRAIGILSDRQARIRVAGGRMALAGARPEVVRLFELIGLGEAFDFFASVDAARNAGDQRAH
jgi:stage II sporulation protein AA (anti-sigma F factor antagonist)